MIRTCIRDSAHCEVDGTLNLTVKGPHRVKIADDGKGRKGYVYVDDKEILASQYKVEGGAHTVQQVTITFAAIVEMEHIEDPPRNDLRAEGLDR